MALDDDQIEALNSLHDHMPELGKMKGVANPNLGDLLAQVDQTVDLSSLTATAAEINKLHSVTAGTAAASKVAVLGANKNLDTLVIAAGGLKIGAGAGTAVTSTAAELNTLASVVAGTAAASKAAVLGANKNLDVLAIADGGLALGAGAGTPILATAVEINNAADDSQKTQAIVAPGAITVDGTKSRVTVTNAVNGAITLAAPSAAMKGKTLVIEFIGAGTNNTTLSLANVQGGSAATTATFNAADETLILVGGETKWNVVKEIGVTLS